MEEKTEGGGEGKGCFLSLLLGGAVWPPPSFGGAAFLPLLWGGAVWPPPSFGGAAVPPPLLNDR